MLIHESVHPQIKSQWRIWHRWRIRQMGDREDSAFHLLANDDASVPSSTGCSPFSLHCLDLALWGTCRNRGVPVCRCFWQERTFLKEQTDRSWSFHHVIPDTLGGVSGPSRLQFWTFSFKVAEWTEQFTAMSVSHSAKKILSINLMFWNNCTSSTVSLDVCNYDHEKYYFTSRWHLRFVSEWPSSSCHVIYSRCRSEHQRPPISRNKSKREVTQTDRGHRTSAPFQMNKRVFEWE